MTKPKPQSQPKIRPEFAWSKFAPAKDGWRQRLNIALRLHNGCVLTARQCEELADKLGIKVNTRI